jgi:hypothetical protein
MDSNSAKRMKLNLPSWVLFGRNVDIPKEEKRERQERRKKDASKG